MREYEKIKNGHRLTTATHDLLHLMYEFGKLLKTIDVVTVQLVDDQLQKLKRILVEYFISISTSICLHPLKIVR